MQEAFIKLWKKPSSFDASRGVKFKTWFYKVITNLAIDYIRKRKPQVGADQLDHISDKGIGADEKLIEDDKRKVLEMAISSLPERQMMALNLCFYEGLSNKEAAEIIGVGVKALESLLMRAKKSLKEHLSNNGILKEKDDV